LLAVAETLSAWCCLEVFCVIALQSILQLPQESIVVSRHEVPGAHGIFNSSDWDKKLDHHDEGVTFCMQAKPGVWLLLTAR